METESKTQADAKAVNVALEANKKCVGKSTCPKNTTTQNAFSSVKGHDHPTNDKKSKSNGSKLGDRNTASGERNSGIDNSREDARERQERRERREARRQRNAQNSGPANSSQFSSSMDMFLQGLRNDEPDAQPVQQAPPTPATNSNTTFKPLEMPGKIESGIPDEILKTEDTQVSSTKARLAFNCQAQASSAANTCQGALRRVQAIGSQAQGLQGGIQSGSTAASCANMADMATQASSQMQREQSSCLGAIQSCQALCTTAVSEVANEVGSQAAVQATYGRGLCEAANSAAQTMGLNVSQIQAAAQMASQCYSDVTGQAFVPKSGQGGQASAVAKSGLGESAGRTGPKCSDPGMAEAPQCQCQANPMSPVCIGMNPELSGEQTAVLADDETGGGGGSGKMGNNLTEPDLLPEVNSTFQASTRKLPTPSVGSPSATNGNPAAAKTPAQIQRDLQAEKTAREFAKLPQLVGENRSQFASTSSPAVANSMGQKMQKFLPGPRRPANAMTIGAKHTNIFNTIAQSYARNADNLNP